MRPRHRRSTRSGCPRRSSTRAETLRPRGASRRAPRRAPPFRADSCAGEPIACPPCAVSRSFAGVPLAARAARAPRRGGRLRRPVDGRDQRVRRLHAARAGCHVDRADAARHRGGEPVHARAGGAGAARRRAGRRQRRTFRARARQLIRRDRRALEPAHVREAARACERRCRCCARSSPAGAALAASSSNAAGEPVPIVIAALRDRMLRLGGELGDGTFVNFLPLSATDHVVERIREGAEGPTEIIAASSASPAKGSTSRASCSPPTARCRSTRFFRGPAGARRSTRWWRRGAGDRKLALERVPEELIREIFILGDPEAMKERLHAFAERGSRRSC